MINWVAVVLAYSSLFMLGVTDNIRGPIFADVMHDLHLSDQEGSMLWAMASTIAFIGAGFGPRIMKRFGDYGSLFLLIFVMGLSQFFNGFSQSFSVALVSAAIYGWSVGALGLVQNILVLRAGPKEKHPRLQAGLHSNYAAASLLAPVVTVVSASAFSGWRGAYFCSGVICMVGLAGGVVLYKSKYNKQSQVYSPPNDKHKAPTLAGAWLGCALGLYVVMEILVSSRIGLLVRREMNEGIATGSLYTALFFAGFFAGRLLFSFWQPKKSLKFQITLSMSASLIVLSVGCLYDVRWIALSGITMAPFYPLTMSYLAQVFPHSLQNVMAIALSINSFLVVIMHMLVGFITEKFGIRQAMIMGPIVAAMSLILLHTHHFSHRFSKPMPAPSP